jgi:glycosyltransferase involved in cell wall biosynthesis
MKLSVIVATRNRAHAIGQCLDSIAAAIGKAAPLDAEIVLVDNGSTDSTFQTVTQWAGASPLPVRVLSEPKAGLSRAHNRGCSQRRASFSLSLTMIADCTRNM